MSDNHSRTGGWLTAVQRGKFVDLRMLERADLGWVAASRPGKAYRVFNLQPSGMKRLIDLYYSLEYAHKVRCPQGKGLHQSGRFCCRPNDNHQYQTLALVLSGRIDLMPLRVGVLTNLTCVLTLGPITTRDHEYCTTHTST